MLIKVKIENFMSIGSLQEFSMLAGKARGKREHLLTSKKLNILRFSALYGANASGKSNFINAIDFSQKVILEGLPKGFTQKYNRANKDNKNKTSHFEFEIKVDNKFYNYGFETLLNENSITKEWLYEINQDSSYLIFNRDLTKNEYSIGKYFKDDNILKRVNIYFDDTKTDESALFLSVMNRDKSELYKTKSELIVFKNIFNWFKFDLDINYPDKPFSNYSYFMTKANSEEIFNTINKFGTGITNFKIIDAKREDIANSVPDELLKDVRDNIEKEIIRAKKESIPPTEIGLLLRGDKEFFIFEVNENYNILTKTIEFEHGSHGTFNICEESDGTRRILELIEILFSENNNRIYIIDEIDRSLHPLLTYKFIESYLNSLGKKNIQLIVTTHESRLLNFDLLRRDEIWFVNKSANNESELYSLEQFNERFDKKVDKSYLLGRYNAIPNFNEV
ncbi:AAA family ATPase [Clostridium weizhouense]|uniref:AAA family ATPase n=1 Tax=Clostridium weizhouense TaxID=2859781 RepID=A0ABS7ARS8_9CLOT|nr:AAA family ATPase [Clostridium weizhouense]MBW6411327.1 AAA family ATPase [Clostridium weizhouense]